MIGQYEVVSKPLMGGMGIVYFCLDHGNYKKPVALKTFRPEFLPDRDARDRFLREGTAWVNLGNHPHIVRCHKVEYIDPTAFLVLELISKEQGMEDASLRSWMGSPMKIEQALLFALQIARGLQHATTRIQGFVHRDLKPENVLVGADTLPGTNVNRLRVTDFGLATILKDEISGLVDGAIGRTHLTRGIVGTPLYMAPEQWMGGTLGIYTDIYALGCILYEMLTSNPVVSGQNISDLQSAHCSGNLSALPEKLPRELKTFLRNCLALQLKERCQTWAESAHEIEQIYMALTGRSALGEMKAMEASREDLKQEGWSYNAIGAAYLDLGKTEAAAVYIEKALSVVHQIGDQNGEHAAINNLGTVYFASGDMQRALRYFDQALLLSRKNNDRPREGRDLNNIGEAYRNLGNAQKAIDHYEQALAIAREASDLEGEGTTLNNLGLVIHKNLSNVKKAIIYYQQSLSIRSQIGDRRGEGHTLDNLGMAYSSMGDFTQATIFYKKSLAVAREIGDRLGESHALGNLGVAYKNLGNQEQAIIHHEEHWKIAREIGDRIGESNALGNLGTTYMSMGNTQRAIGYYEQRIKIAREIGDRIGECNSLGNLGSAYWIMDDVQQALDNFEQGLTIANEIGAIDQIASFSFNAAQIYVQVDNLARATGLAQKALRLWEQIESPKLQYAQQLVAKLGNKKNPGFLGGLFSRK
jgi:serine/threonine protein kinase